jgi:hypothetical protein
MLKEIIAQASERMQECFEAGEINQAARATHLVVRQSKMDGNGFLKTMVFGCLENPETSLNDWCQISQDLGISISKQGLDERLTEEAVTFLKNCLAKALKCLQARRGKVLSVLEQFSEVYLQDSTVQSLPISLQALFPGSGGNASPAALKIQLMFGLCSGNLVHVTLQAGRASDACYTEHVLHMLPGSLLLQDLGFFNLPALQTVHEQDNFYLSRWRQDTVIYLPEQPDSPVEMLSFLSAQTQPLADYSVQVGKTAHLPCRMIVVRLPQEVAEQRRRRLRDDAQRRGKPLSARALALCAWNVFLTNLPPERLSLHQLLACYALRWQIELIFKLWKSQAGLKHLAGLRPGRILCEIYAKLIGLLLTHFLIAPLRLWYIDQRIEISLSKAHSILQHCLSNLLPALNQDLTALQIQLEDLFQRILRLARKDKRVKSPSSLLRLALADQFDLAFLFPLA